MTNYDIYGTSALTGVELARVVTERLGVDFTERESQYRGLYQVAELAGARVEIQPNTIPGDDGQDELYAEEHAAAITLLLTISPVADTAMRVQLEAIDGLVHLGHESS